MNYSAVANWGSPVTTVWPISSPPGSDILCQLGQETQAPPRRSAAGPEPSRLHAVAERVAAHSRGAASTDGKEGETAGLGQGGADGPGRWVGAAWRRWGH